MKGHFEKAGVEARRFLFEVPISAEEAGELEIGQQIDCGTVFGEVSRVDVTGVSKGRGFTGVIKRHNMSVKRRTHGTHENTRHGGAIGAGA